MIQIQSIIITFAVIMLLFLVERLFPLRRASRPLGHRLWINACLSILTFAVAAAIVRPVSTAAIQWSHTQHFGLMYLIPGPLYWQMALGFLLMDATFYYWHRLNHRLFFLWRFHNVHHIDPDLDTSTGFRFHFGEVALSAFFRAIQVLVIGTSLELLVIYELIFQVETYFHHSNLRLPLKLEQALNLFIVTPRMHGIHHSQFHNETDSNYSVIFSFWDRLHRTFTWGISETEITIGVPGYYREEDNKLVDALLAPFRRQRDYWQGREARKAPRPSTGKR